MSAQPAPTQPLDPITLPGATILSLGAELLEGDAQFHNEALADVPTTTAKQFRQLLRKRDVYNYRLGLYRGFAQGMCVSMVAWVVVSLVASCFGEYETVVKGVMMGVYIWVFAQTYWWIAEELALKTANRYECPKGGIQEVVGRRKATKDRGSWYPSNVLKNYGFNLFWTRLRHMHRESWHYHRHSLIAAQRHFYHNHDTNSPITYSQDHVHHNGRRQLPPQPCFDKHYAEKLDRAVTAMYSILESVLADGSAGFSQIDSNTIHPSVFVHKAMVVEKKLALIRRNMVLNHPTFLDEQRDAEQYIEKIELARVQASMESSMKDSYFSGILHAALLWIVANMVSPYFGQHATFVKWALVALCLPFVARGWTMTKVPSVAAWVRSRHW